MTVLLQKRRVLLVGSMLYHSIYANTPSDIDLVFLLKKSNERQPLQTTQSRATAHPLTVQFQALTVPSRLRNSSFSLLSGQVFFSSVRKKNLTNKFFLAHSTSNVK